MVMRCGVACVLGEWVLYMCMYSRVCVMERKRTKYDGWKEG